MKYSRRTEIYSGLGTTSVGLIRTRACNFNVVILNDLENIKNKVKYH